MKNILIVGGLIIVLAAGYVYVSAKKATILPSMNGASPTPAGTVTASPDATADTTPDAKVDPALVLGVFKGVIPCADCSGIETELTLIKEDEDAAEGSYILSERYIDRSPEPFVTRGAWTTIRGTKTNPNATVYELDPDKENPSFYLRVNDNEIKMLGADQSEIDSDLNFSLTKSP